MDRFDAMSAFVAVAQTGSFSAAARRLGAPLASVSRNVSELEERLGVQLLARSTRKTVLTESGRKFFEIARGILDKLADAERAASGEYHTPRGRLVITAPIVLGRQHVVPIVAEFLNVYREVKVELRLTGRFPNLVEDGVDLAIWGGQLPETGQTTTYVGSLKYVICASPDYLATRGPPLHPHDLAHLDCVIYAGLGVYSYNQWAFKLGGTSIHVPVRGRLKVATAEAAVAAAVSGAGLIRMGVLPVVAEAIADGQLIAVLAEYESESLPVYIVLPPGDSFPIRLHAFLDFMAPRFQSRLRSMA
jgi:DNA-binding transcriptional LysR family regulator